MKDSTRRIDIFASHWHYLDHMAPVWRALPDEVRGDVLIESPRLRAHPLVHEASGDLRKNTKPSLISRVLVAGSADAKIAARYGWSCALMEHGAGQLYPHSSGAKASSANAGGVDRHTIGLFLCTNEAVAEANARAYGRHRVVVVGSPRLEDLRSARDLFVPRSPPTLALTWHWPCNVAPTGARGGPPWSGSLLNDFHTALVHLRSKWRGPMIGTSHPRAQNQARTAYRSVGIEYVPDFTDVLMAADVLSFDNTSAGWEAAALGVPVVLLSSPWWSRDVEQGLRFWKWADIGPEVVCDTYPEALADRWVEAAVTALTQRHLYAPKAVAMSAEVFPYREDSTQRAVDALLRWIGSPHARSIPTDMAG